MNTDPAAVNTETDVLAPSLDKSRLLLEAAAAVVVLVPLVMLAVDRFIPSPSAAALTAAAAAENIDLAVKLLNSGKPSESLEPLARAQLLDPDSFSVFNNQCVAYGLLERRDEAVASCSRALELEPKNQLGKNNLAWVKGITPRAP